MKILVVDDEKLIRDVIKEYLELNNFECYQAEDGVEAIEVTENHNIDLIIMDIMMPKLDGYSACREIYKNRKIPTIMLSARKEEYDKLLGFELGIDDYVTKPFSPKELIARVKAVLKRSNDLEKYEYQGLELNFKAHTFKINNQEVQITLKEYELLTFLVLNKNIVFTREQLLAKVWGYDFYGDNRTVDTHIKMLRKHLGEYKSLIVTVHGVGYKFEIKDE